MYVLYNMFFYNKKIGLCIFSADVICVKFSATQLDIVASDLVCATYYIVPEL